MSKEEKIEIDSEVVDAVSAKAAEQATTALKESFTMPTAKEIAEEMVAMTEKTVKAPIKEKEATAPKKSEYETLSKEARFARGVIAFKNGNAKGIAEYNSYANKAWSEKSDYQNVTTTADGGALVPDPEFMAEVERLTDEYGVASRLATVRMTDRDSVTMLSGTNEIDFTKVGEATAQNAEKLTYAKATVALDKYIATLVLTSEIVEDSAVNMWQDATNEIARARAKLFDKLVFTDSTYGLLSASAGDTYKTQTVGANLAAVDADDFMDSIYKVVSSARRGGRFFMHPTVWNELRQTKTGDASNSAANYYFGAPGQAVQPTIDGYPVELVDILPDAGDITANEPFAVFGDLSRILIHNKRLLETKVFDSGTVPDAGGTDINLISQDSWAIRATLRAVPQTRFQGAFVIIGTGTVS